MQGTSTGWQHTIMSPWT